MTRSVPTKALRDLLYASRSADSLKEMTRIIAESAGARLAYVVYGADTFRRLGDSHGNEELEFKAGGYWVANRHLVREGGVTAFNVVDGRVVDVVKARAGVQRSHLAALLPMREGASEMLVLSGIGTRLTSAAVVFVEAAANILAHSVSRIIDAELTRRLRAQMDALSDIAGVISRTRTKEETLTELATALAAASGFDSVAIAVFDRSRTRVQYRGLNQYRFSNHPVSDAFRAGAFDRVMLQLGARRTPTTISDANTDSDDVDEIVRRMLIGDSLFAAISTFPLIVRDEIIGCIALNSFRPHAFDDAEMRLLQGLASQAAMIIKGIEMYEELRTSREQLQEYARKLQDSMGIEYRLARTDALTGLPNRRFLDEALTSEFTRKAQTGEPLSVVLADVDQFKLYNDRYGHTFGDDVLKMVAATAWRTRRSGELAGRYGGDEFLFILPGRSSESALYFAEEFRQAIASARLFSPIGQQLDVSVSVGVAECQSNACDPFEVVACADRSMYEAKGLGGNRVGSSAVRAAADTSPT